MLNSPPSQHSNLQEASLLHPNPSDLNFSLISQSYNNETLQTIHMNDFSNPVLKTDAINPFDRVSRLLKFDLMKVANESLNLNASLGQEPSVKKIYSHEFLVAKASNAGIKVEFLHDGSGDLNEVKIVQRDIEIIPKLILTSDFKSIKVLDIQRNKIKELEGRLFAAMKNLQVLNASRNLIKHISCKVSLCPSLQNIILDDNQLEVLPSEIGSLIELQQLSCHNNRLKYVPISIINLTKLRVLKVSTNKIRSLPRGIKNLQDLEDLQIQNNKIRNLYPEFHDLKKLSVFGCDWFHYATPCLNVLQSSFNIRYSENNYDEDDKDADDYQRLQMLQKLSTECHAREDDSSIQISFLEFIKYFSQQKPFYIDYLDERNRSLLHIAVLKSDSTAVEMLLQSQIDANIIDKDGYSALGIAIRDEKFKIALKLLQHHSVNVNIGGGTYCHQLHLAVSKLHVEIVEKLLLRGANVNTKDTNSGDSPLHLLMSIFGKSLTNSKKILELLANNDADLNARNNDLWTPLHIAVKRGCFDAVECLLNLNNHQGREFPKLGNLVDIDSQGGIQRWTALHLASYGSYYRIAGLLIDCKADLFIHNVDGKTAFSNINNNLLMIKLLKKAMVSYTLQSFTHDKKVNQYHLANKVLITRLIGLYTSKQKQKRHSNMFSFKDTLKILKHYVKFPKVIDNQQLFHDRKFNPSIQPFKATVGVQIHLDVAKIQSQDQVDDIISPSLSKQNSAHQKPDLAFSPFQKHKHFKIVTSESPQFNIHGYQSERTFQTRFRSSTNTNAIKEQSKYNQNLTNMDFKSKIGKQHANIFYIKEAFLEPDFKYKCPQDQHALFLQFKELIQPENEKHISAFVALLQIMNSFRYEYLVDQILEYAQILVNTSNLHIRQSIIKTLKQIKKDFIHKEELYFKIDDILEQSIQKRIDVNIIVRKASYNLENSLTKSKHVLNYQINHQIKNPFKNSGKTTRLENYSKHDLRTTKKLPSIKIDTKTRQVLLRNNERVIGAHHQIDLQLSKKMIQLDDTKTLSFNQSGQNFDFNHNPCASKQLFLSPKPSKPSSKIMQSAYKEDLVHDDFADGPATQKKEVKFKMINNSQSVRLKNRSEYIPSGSNFRKNQQLLKKNSQLNIEDIQICSSSSSIGDESQLKVSEIQDFEVMYTNNPNYNARINSKNFQSNYFIHNLKQNPTLQMIMPKQLSEKRQKFDLDSGDTDLEDTQRMQFSNHQAINNLHQQNSQSEQKALQRIMSMRKLLETPQPPTTNRIRVSYK